MLAGSHCGAIRGGTLILNDQPTESLPAELAPFLAAARDQLDAATDGLQPHEVIEHLETTLAKTEAEASRLGISISPPVAMAPQATVSGAEGDSPVVVIRQMVEPGEL